MKNLSTIFYCSMLSFLICNASYSQKRVGDPGVEFDDAKYDNRYPQMLEWQKAGVRGGIPYLENIRIFKTLDNGANSSQINQALDDAAKENELVGVLLKNGTYNINSAVKMKSNVALIGESRNGVRCIISMNSGNGFRFDNVTNSGIYKLTIEGSWGVPKYKWNYSLSENDELKDVDNISVKIVRSEDCWLDKVNIYNSARDPIRVPSNHITLRDLDVKGAHKKAGGAQGYFFIQGAYNLVTGCKVTHLRHISLQGENVEYNVVFDNQFKQEVSFHSGDAGNNLIEKNEITLPSDMSPITNDELEPGDPEEIATNKPVYFAIMGPWSTQHSNSEKPNFVMNNTCLQLNHDYGSATPWSTLGILYKGPLTLGLSIEERINNFPEVDSNLNPSGSTLYPVANVNTLSIQDYNAKTLPLSIYPVPANTKFYISIEDDTSYQIDLEIINIKGQVVKKINAINYGVANTIDISSLSSGVYLVKAKDHKNRRSSIKKLAIDQQELKNKTSLIIDQ